MVIKGFDVFKGVGKFLLGAVATGIAFLLSSPEVTIYKLIPEHWQTLTIAGLILEGLDYLLHKINNIGK